MGLCNITGHLYNPLGNVVTQGKLYVTLQQDMVTDSGQKIAPFTVTVDLSATSGYVDITVQATVGSTPEGIAYKVEFDPDPSDVSKPIKAKDGYWRNYWAVPDSGSASLGSFVTALRGTPSYNYLPIGTTISSFSDTVTMGSAADINKGLRAPQVSFTPEIRFNATTDEWEFTNDGSTWQNLLQGGGGSAGGDLSGTLSSASVIKIRGSAVSSTAPSTTGQYLRWNNATTQYEPSLDASALTGLNASNLSSGTVPLARLSGITNAELSASANIAWSKINFAGSSLSNLATRSASDLTSGTLPVARLPIATTVDVGAVKPDGTTITINGSGVITSVGGAPTGSAGGDLGGTYPNPSVTKVRGNTFANSAATADGQFWRWNNSTTQFELTTDGSLLTALNASNLTSGSVPIARISNLTDSQIAAAAAIDATKIANGSVSNTEFQLLDGQDQTVATTSTPRFARIGLGAAADSSAALKIVGQVCGAVVEKGNSGSSMTLNWNDGNDQRVVLTAGCTLTFSNPKDSGRYLIRLKQDGTGGWAVTWPANVYWSGGSAPTLSAANKTDLIVLVYDVADDRYLGTSNLNY